MDIDIKITKNNNEQLDLEVDKIKFQKMVFLYNALENGWSIKKRKDSYIFTKNHEGKKEVFEDNYLNQFMKINFDMKTIIS